MTSLATSTFYYKGEGTFWFEVRPWTLIEVVLSSVFIQIHVWIFLFMKKSHNIYWTQNVKNKVQHVPLQWQCPLAWCCCNVP